MTVGSWEPGSDSRSIPSEALKNALRFSDVNDFPSTVPDAVAALQAFMAVPEELWRDTLSTQSSDNLKKLCRFFTLAEDQWPDWFGGDRNPVIWICRELKTRGDFPDKTLTAWIKQHSQNRFLPYGNVLG